MTRKKGANIAPKPKPENLIQLDGDPIEDRRQSDGSWRPMLTPVEKDVLKYRKTIQQAVELLIADRDFVDIAEELGEESGALVTEMLHHGGDAARAAFIDRVLDKILDIETAATRTSIAAEMGMGTGQFNRLLMTDDFKEAYTRRFIELRSDPAIQIYRQGFVEDLLPKAYHALEDLIDNPRTPATVRMQAIAKVLDITGMGPEERQRDDNSSAMEFLSKMGQVNITQINNFSVPPEYAEAMKDVVIGEVKELPTED